MQVYEYALEECSYTTPILQKVLNCRANYYCCIQYECLYWNKIKIYSSQLHIAIAQSLVFYSFLFNKFIFGGCTIEYCKCEC